MMPESISIKHNAENSQRENEKQPPKANTSISVEETMCQADTLLRTPHLIMMQRDKQDITNKEGTKQERQQ